MGKIVAYVLAGVTICVLLLIAFVLWVVGSFTGDENTRLYVAQVEGPGTDLRELMPAPRTVTSVVEAVDGTADFIVTSNQRDKRVFDLYRVSAAGGAPVLLATNPGTVGWWGVDREGQLRARSRIEGDQVVLERPGAEPGSWQPALQRSRWDSLRVFGVHDAGRKAWALSNLGRQARAGTAGPGHGPGGIVVRIARCGPGERGAEPAHTRAAGGELHAGLPGAQGVRCGAGCAPDGVGG